MPETERSFVQSGPESDAMPPCLYATFIARELSGSSKNSPDRLIRSQVSSGLMAFLLALQTTPSPLLLNNRPNPQSQPNDFCSVPIINHLCGLLNLEQKPNSNKTPQPKSGNNSVPTEPGHEMNIISPTRSVLVYNKSGKQIVGVARDILTVYGGGELPIKESLLKKPAYRVSFIDANGNKVYGLVYVADVKDYLTARNQYVRNDVPNAKDPNITLNTETNTIQYDSVYDYSLSPMADQYNIGLWTAKLSDPAITSLDEALVGTNGVVSGSIVLEAGEEFDFVRRFGPFSSEQGYAKGRLASGKPGTGTGVCQVATAIYYAALELGLKIKPFTQHPPIEGFTEKGKQTVSILTTDPNQNLVFTNSNQRLVLEFVYDKNTKTFSVRSIVQSPQEKPSANLEDAENASTLTVDQLMAHDPNHPALKMIPPELFEKYPWVNYMPNDIMYWLPEMINVARKIIEDRKSKGQFVGDISAEEYAIIFSKIVDMESGGGPLCLSSAMALGLTAVMPVNYFNTLIELGEITPQELRRLLEEGTLKPDLLTPQSRLIGKNFKNLPDTRLSELRLQYGPKGTPTQEFALAYLDGLLDSDDKTPPREEWYPYKPERNLAVGMTFFGHAFFRALLKESQQQSCPPNVDGSRVNDPVFRAWLRAARVYNGGPSQECNPRVKQTIIYGQNALGLVDWETYKRNPSKALRIGWPGYTGSFEQWNKLGVNPIDTFFIRGQDPFIRIRTRPVYN